MLYQSLFNIAQHYPNKLALNDLTYENLLDQIDQVNYEFIVEDTNYLVLVKILKAAKLGKPIVILPKNRQNISLPTQHKDTFELIMYSSGSSSSVRLPKVIPEKMIMANSANIIDIQKLNSESKILGVSSLNHTGGINTQTLPGLLTGAHIIIDSFNAFNYCKKLDEYKITHSHLLPANVEALIKTQNVLPSTVKLIMIGGDCIYKRYIDYLLNHNISILHAYGMTEAGPPVIYHNWNPGDDTTVLSSVPGTEGVFLGSKCVSDYKIIDNELFLKGEVIASDDWLPTGDCVYKINEWFVYKGRKSAGCKIIPKAHW